MAKEDPPGPLRYHPATMAFYNAEAKAFAGRSVIADLKDLQDAFMSHFLPGSHILDVGCGSGRDSKVFLDNGFQVTAIEPSHELAAFARSFCGERLTLETLYLHEIPWKARFDGVWASASLLHIPHESQSWAIQRLLDALVPGGTLYASYKEGERYQQKPESEKCGSEQLEDQRLFVNHTEESLAALIETTSGTLLEIWQSFDGEGRTRRWWNVLVQAS